MTAMTKTFTMVCLACALLGAGRSVAQCDETAVLPSKAEIRAMQGASPTIQWAVERVAKELESVFLYGIGCQVCDDSRVPRVHYILSL